MCTPNLKTTAVIVPMDGSVHTQQTTSQACYVFGFNVPANFVFDVLIAGTVSNSFNFFQSIINSNSWTMPNPISESVPFLSPWNISFANCQIAQDTTWYLLSQYTGTGGDNITISVSTTTAATIRTIPFGTTYVGGQVTSPATWDLAVISLPSATKAVSISLNTTISGYLRRDKCPTLAMNDYSAFFGNPVPLSTVIPNEVIYMGVHSGFTSSYSGALNVQLVQCGVIPSSYFKTCKVSYSTPLLNQQQVATNENTIGFVTAFLGLFGGGSQCVNPLTQLLCGAAFPKCDPNGFPLAPCPQDCQSIKSNCPSFNITSCNIPSANTYCYVGDSVQINSSFVLIFAIIALLLFGY